MCQGLERLAKGSFGGEDWGPVVGGGFGNDKEMPTVGGRE